MFVENVRRTNSTVTNLATAREEQEIRWGKARQGQKGWAAAEPRGVAAGTGKVENAEPKLSRAVCQFSVHSLNVQLNQGKGMTSTNAGSDSGWSRSGTTKGEASPWLSLIHISEPTRL